MKKIVIISLILWVILLWGCSKNQESQEPQNSNTLSKAELFDKKKECASYEEQIKQTISERNKLFETDPSKSYEKLQEIFYSPEKNSCLYIVKRAFFDVCEEVHQEQLVYDFFSKYEWWIIGSKICPCSKSQPDEYCKYDSYYSINNEIAKLKWE